MATQVQCPNCGGFKSNTQIMRSNLKTGKVYPSNRIWFMLILAIVAWMWIALIILVDIVNILNILAGGKITQGVNDLGTIAGASIGSTLFFLPLAIFFSYRVKRMRAHAKRYDHICAICGKEWQQSPGEAIPISVNPVLQQKGNQLLEQQAQQTAMYYHQRQQNK